MIKNLNNQKEFTNKNNQYDKLKFSPDFLTRWVDSDCSVDGMKKIKIDKLIQFNDFYTKYGTYTQGVRVMKGIDHYKEAKVIFDKIMTGELYVDEVLNDPDDILRNIIMLLHIDEYKINKKK